MSETADEPVPPPCPKCQQQNVIFAYVRFGLRVYMCVDCEHAWDVNAADAPRSET